jgi:hypothetical protein
MKRGTIRKSLRGLRKDARKVGRSAKKEVRHDYKWLRRKLK